MPRPSIHRLSQQVLERAAEGSEAQHIQLRVEFRMSPKCEACRRELREDAKVCPRRDCRTPVKPWKPSDQELLGSVGGEWDTEEKRFVGPGTKARVWYCNELQRETVVYWFAWLRAFITGDWEAFTAAHGTRPFTLWTVGGRRRGKTWLGVRFLAAFAIACPYSIPPWMASPIETDFQEAKELHREWVKALPPSWYTWVAKKEEFFIQMTHGVRILMLPAHNAEKLKQGGMGYCFWNEVQKSNGAQRALNNLRGGAADLGTLVHCAANPAREPDEYWIEEIIEKLERGEVEGRFFDFRGDNPYVNEDALDSMKSEMSLRDYEIEREGKRKPRPDIVLHEFVDGPLYNVRPIPETGEITEAFLRRKLGRPFAAIAGADFQKNPHQAACVDRLFADPHDETNAFSWTVAEAVIDQGDEDDMIDELESLGFCGTDKMVCLSCGHEAIGLLRAGATCHRCKTQWLVDASGGRPLGVHQILATAMVTDATGRYQRSNRDYNKARGYGDEHGSWAIFRKRGWIHLFKPDATQERNPHVDERVKVANARLCTGDGRRHAFISPHCVRTIEAVKHWPNAKWGGPSRQSLFSHVGDAYTYKFFRLWPRRVERGGAPKIEIVDIHNRGDRAWT